MKVAFVYNGAENLGIEHLSAVLRSKGHESFLFFDPSPFRGDSFLNIQSLANLNNVDRAIVNGIVELKPDLLAFSSFTGNYRWGLSLAATVKRLLDVPVVFGGIHPSAVPERVLDYDCIDYVVTGDGEYPLLELLDHLAAGEDDSRLIGVPNMAIRIDGEKHITPPRPYVSDLDSLPFPDKPLFFDAEPLIKRNPYLIMTARGCPYDCTFCSNDMLQNLYAEEKRHVRRRSAENVIEELLWARTLTTIRQVNFNDDVFTVSKQWLEEFVEPYRRKIGLPFYCVTHPSAVTPEIAELLAEAGCHVLSMGVQSGSERIRRDIYARRETNERVLQSVAWLQEKGIAVSVDHIFGAPSESREDLEEARVLYRTMKPEIMSTFWLTYYPRTAMVDYSLERGALTKADVEALEEGFTGYSHGSGSVDPRDLPMLARYEFLFQLVTLVRNDRLFRVVERVARFIPMKKKLSYGLFAVAGLRHNWQYYYHKLRYAWVCALRGLSPSNWKNARNPLPLEEIPVKGEAAGSSAAQGLRTVGRQETAPSLQS